MKVTVYSCPVQLCNFQTPLNEVELFIGHTGIFHFSDEIWMQPLSATKHKKLSGVESLKKFIRDVTQPNGDQQYLNITREQSVVNFCVFKIKILHDVSHSPRVDHLM